MAILNWGRWLIICFSSTAANGRKHRIMCNQYAVTMQRCLAFAVALSLSPNLIGQDVPQQERPVKDAPPLPEFSLSITKEGVQGKTAVEVYPKQMFEPFLKQPGRKIEWNPREHLDKAKLVCLLTGDELEIGHDESSPVWIDYTTDPIYLDKPGKLELKVTSPQSIKPGVYQGRLKVRFIPLPANAMNTLMDAYWPVTLIAHGRILTEFKFFNANTDGLHVGQAATVTALLDTIGCEPGIGELKLRYSPFSGSSRPLLNLPMPIEGFIDPLVDLVQVNQREKVCPEWRDQVLHSTMKAVENERSIPGYKQYRVTFHTGPCFAPGESIEAELTWPQAESAPSESKRSFTKRCRAEVSGGILVTPQVAFDTEQVHLQVISREDLGPTVKLTLIAPDSQHGEVTLTRPQNSGTNSGSAGILYTYHTEFPPGQLGSWQVTWPTSDPKVKVDAAHPAHFDVWGRRINRLVHPVRVFASETPIGWDFRSNPYKGRGYHENRFEAFELGVDNRFAGSVQFRPLLIYAGTSQSGEVIPWNPDRHPYLLVAPGTPKLCPTKDQPCPSPDGSIGDHRARSQEYAVDEISTSSTIALPEEGLLPFSVSCSVIPLTDEHPRKTLRDHQAVYRAMLHGTDGEGRPFTRIIEIPFTVQVTNHWEYYREWMLWALGIIVLISTAVYMYWRATRDPKPRTMLSPDLKSGINDFPEFTGGGNQPQSPSEQNAPNTQAASKEQPVKEKRRSKLDIPPPTDNSHLGDF